MTELSSLSTKTVSVLSSEFNKKKKMTCKELFYHIGW